MSEGEEFMSSGWERHRVVAKGAVDLWRKPVAGSEIDAVRLQGTIVPHDLDLAAVAALMRNREVKIPGQAQMWIPIPTTMPRKK